MHDDSAPLADDLARSVVESWQQFTLRDVAVLLTAWCVGFTFVAGQRAPNFQDHRHYMEIEWLLWGFLVGGVLAAPCLLGLQRMVNGRTSSLSFGERLAFYPPLALVSSVPLLFVAVALSLIWSESFPWAMEIGGRALAILHCGFGLLALTLLFVPRDRLACPWLHRFGCWNTILSVVCFLLHVLQRTWFYIEI